jgi:acetyl-CoA carboxylase biotin carboxyl carrier protein
MTDDARVGGLPDDEPVNPETAEVAEPGSVADPTDAAGDGAAPGTADDDLLALIDRLAALLDRSDLAELEVEAGGTGLVLRKPVALAVAAGTVAGPMAGDPPAQAPERGPVEPAATERPAIRAPLTGIFYGSPAPGSAPYVQVGGEVAIGQVIGLIEAMKLFNEIKSDLAGRVVKVVAESGALVKAKQPLIEVEPL